MKIYCPQCGVKGSADDSYSGRKVRCPKCQEMFVLMPAMAIDQSGVLAAASGVEDIGKAVERDVVQEESGGGRSLPAEEQQPDELFVEDEDAVDWDSFGAELDREVAESEQEGMTSDFLEGGASLEDESPAPGAVDESDELAEDFGAFWGAGVDDAEEGDENQLEVEIAPDISTEEDDIIDVDDDALKIDETADDNFSALTTPEGETSLPVDDVSREDRDEEATTAMAFTEADLSEDDGNEPDGGDAFDDIEVIEDEPYGIDKEQCWQCGKEDSAGEVFTAIEGRLYCTDCLPVEEPADTESVSGTGSVLTDQEPPREEHGVETVEQGEEKKVSSAGGVISKTWDKVKVRAGAVYHRLFRK